MACVPFHACDAREVSGEWARLPQEKAALVSQRGEHLISKFLSVVSAASKRSANFLPVSHTPARPSLAGARARGGMFYSVDLLSPKGALGQIWVRRTRTTRLAPAPGARFPLSSSVPVLHPPSTERVCASPRRAFADPGAPAEPRGSPEPAQIRQALRGGRVRHHHEAPLSAGTSSRARRKRVSDTTPETSRGSPRARTRRRALTCRIRGGAPTTRIVAGTSTRRAADARGRDPVLPPGTRAARSPAASLSFSHVKYVFVVAFFFSRFPPSDALLFFPLCMHTYVTKTAALPVRGLLFVPHAPRPPRARLE